MNEEACLPARGPSPYSAGKRHWISCRNVTRTLRARSSAIDTAIINLTPDRYPWELLLLADPSKAQVSGYLDRSIVLGAVEDSEIIGVAVLTPTGEETMEIMNIAVAESRQGRGLGKRLLVACEGECERRGIRRIDIGTGNSSLSQLGLYQKAGFRITGVITDYFTRNYPEPIVEGGIQCRDMIRLSKEIQSENQ